MLWYFISSHKKAIVGKGETGISELGHVKHADPNKSRFWRSHEKQPNMD